MTDVSVPQRDISLCDWFTSSIAKQIPTLQPKIPLVSCLYKPRPAQSSLYDARGKIITWVRHDSSRSWDSAEWLVVFFKFSVNWMNHTGWTGKLDSSQAEASLHRRGGAARLLSAQTHNRRAVTSQSEFERKVRSLISLLAKPIPNVEDCS